MKKLLKKFIPNLLKRMISKYLNNQIITNFYKTNYTRRALLSYITSPFKKDSLSHTNYFEAQSWAKILHELGYIVDVIHYENSKKIDLSKYDLICGFGDVFQHYFENIKNTKTKTIYYATGMHVCHQNHATLTRIKDVYEKKQIWLGKSARFVEKTWTHQTSLVDGIIALGNEVCADSYRKYFDGHVYALPATFYKTFDAEIIINQRTDESKKHYLWFGSSGLIHKGLDLCLEYFVNNQDVYLHVCGPIENEPEFVATYKKELFETPNIKTYGFVDIQSKEFEYILINCSFSIFPSCSEGGAVSVLTTIGNGGLIPIITKETTINTGHEIWIDGLNYENIDRVIKKSKEFPSNVIRKMQHENQKIVLQKYSQEKYYNELRKNIQTILGISE